MTDKIEEIEKQIAALQALKDHVQGLDEAREKVEALAEELGYTIDELFYPHKKDTSTTQRRAKAKPKYRDPENHRKSWAGEDSGRPMPEWLKEKLEAGHKIEEFLIDA